MATPDVRFFHEDDHRFSIDRSTIPGAGNGLFANEPLAEGDRLEVIGPLIRAETPSDLCTAYADRHKFRVGGVFRRYRSAMAARSTTPIPPT